MKCLNALSIVPVMLAVLATPALAQDLRPETETPNRVLTGNGGPSFSHDFGNVSGGVAIEYQERVARDVSAYANFSWMSNLMSDKMRQNLDLASSMLGSEFTGRDRGMMFTMGAKYFVHTQRRIRPYFGGGAGIANLKRTIKESTFGDVSESFFFMTGLNDGVIDAGKNSTTNPLAEGMVGVAAAFKNRAYVDVHYKYGHIFQTIENVDYSQLSFGVGMTF